MEDYPPWSDLPLELVNLVASRLSLVDRINFPLVCKNWSLIDSSVSNAKRWPWLMYIEKPTKGKCKFFDPLDGKVYNSRYELPDEDVYYALLFSKDGWVLITDEFQLIILTEALGDGWVRLPPLPFYCKTFSFSSTPTSSDCIVFGIQSMFDDMDSQISILTWRYGDNEWSCQDVVNNLPFLFARNSPVFHDELFYCLGRYGNLGVFDPKKKTWTVLDKPMLSPSKINLNLMIDSDRGMEDCYLVKSSKGDLLSVLDRKNGKPLLVMKLDVKHDAKLKQPKLAWEKIKDLDDEIIFVDMRASISIQAPVRGTGNRIYFSKWYNNDIRREGAYYCFKNKKFYSNAESELEEVVDCVWIMPM